MTFSKRTRTDGLLLGMVAAVLFAALFSDAQTPTPNKTSQPPAGSVAQPPAKQETDISATTADLETKLAETEVAIGENQKLETGAVPLQTGIKVEDVQARIAALQSLAAALQQHISTLRDVIAARDQLAASQKARETFKQLDEKPPYTMAVVDALIDQADARQMELDAENLAVGTLRQALSMEQGDAEAAKTAINQTASSVGIAAGDDERNLALWNAETARISWRAADTRVNTTQAAMERSQVQQERLKTDCDLAQKKIKTARLLMVFREAELNELRKKQEDIDKSLAREIETARRELDRRRAKLSDLERRIQVGADPATVEPARNEADVERERVESGNAALSALENLKRCEQDIKDAWERRYKIANRLQVSEELSQSETLNRLKDQADSVHGAQRVSEQRALSLRAQINTLEQQVAAMAEGDAGREPAKKRLAALRENELAQDRSRQRLSAYAVLLDRTTQELEARLSAMSPSERIGEVRDLFRTVYARTIDRELAEIGGESLTPRKLFTVLIILAVGFILTKLVLRYLRNRLFPRLRIRSNVALIGETLVKYILLFVVFYSGLQYLNIPLTVFTFLGGAVAIGVGFGAQNLISNFLSGLILMGEQPIRIGDIVEVDGHTGNIASIGARASVLRTFSGIDVLIPNSKFLENKVINWTLSDSRMRFDVRIGVAYGSPTRDVAKMLHRATTEHGQVLSDPEPVVVFDDFGDNALHFVVYFWLDISNTDSRMVRSDIRHRVYRLFEEADITLAFPQRDVHIDTAHPIDIRIIPSDDRTEKKDEKTIPLP